MATVGDFIKAVDDGERVEALAEKVGWRLVGDGVARLRDRLVGVAERGVRVVVVVRWAGDCGGVCHRVGARASSGQYRTGNGCVCVCGGEVKGV